MINQLTKPSAFTQIHVCTCEFQSNVCFFVFCLYFLLIYPNNYGTMGSTALRHFIYLILIV